MKTPHTFTGNSILSLLRAAAQHCSLAATRGAPLEYRLRHVDEAQRTTLQALACINGPAGVRAPVAPRADRYDRHAALPTSGRVTWTP